MTTALACLWQNAPSLISWTWKEESPFFFCNFHQVSTNMLTRKHSDPPLSTPPLLMTVVLMNERKILAAAKDNLLVPSQVEAENDIEGLIERADRRVIGEEKTENPHTESKLLVYKATLFWSLASSVKSSSQN